ncbi:MAG: hypothetical protein HOB54_05415, partial [Flavobacteriales bacterium]|nr:hypothetical protein [Flavobacteriales bacterium]
TLSATSFVKLHRDVLGPSCNVMGCHDGSFEPDFRTVQSSYNTLVYHPILKNNLDETFTYRVVPGDTANSVLHERLTNCCFVNTNDRMPQDNIGNALPQEDLDKVANWILDDAKDITGSIPNEPNNLPNIKYYYVTNTTYDSTYSDNREDGVFYKPFLMPANEQVNFIFRVTDDNTNAGAMLINELSISEYQDDFSNSINVISQVFDSNYHVWILTFDTSILVVGETYFLRYTINDGVNTANTTYPNNQTSYVYKSMWSFTVQ